MQNSPPLVTSNKAREKYGLPLRTYADGRPPRFDSLRPQRLAAPVTVYVQQFSAHPLERDGAELYAPPDGYLDPDGNFYRERRGPDDVPVYEVTLRPEDGLYFLPYMARQANGQAWEEDGTERLAPQEQCRQPYYPDASRIVEEIDRFGLGERGLAGLLSSEADFDYYRPAPSGGYKKGLPAAERTDVGEGDIPPERHGEHFFVYRPSHLHASPPRSRLAYITNVVQQALATGSYAGGIWLEGSPTVEESTYWLNLLIDTTVPIVGNASQRAHGTLANDGDHNLLDSVHYITSGIWRDAEGRDDVGGVVIQDQQVFAARDVQKADARPGGYTATGGHGGIVGTAGHPGPPKLSFRPVPRHTHTSAVNLSRLPDSVMGTRRLNGKVELVPLPIKNERGELLPTAIPSVRIEKMARYLDDSWEANANDEVDILARIEKNLRDAPLAGFIGEGSSGFGSMSESVAAALWRASLSGMPVVRVGRGNNEGFTQGRPRELCLGGGNLTATKARLLLMACLMRFGSPPPAADPDHPTDAELTAIRAKLADYQAVFDTH
jgi:hypothetical protein